MTTEHHMELQRAIISDLENSPPSGGSCVGVLRRKFGFGPAVRPLRMLDSVLAANPDRLADLGDSARMEASRWWLQRALRRALRPDDTADAAVALAQIDALPEAAQRLFPQHVRMTLAALAERGESLPMPQGGLPTAHALLMHGDLVQTINGIGDDHE